MWKRAVINKSKRRCKKARFFPFFFLSLSPNANNTYLHLSSIPSNSKRWTHYRWIKISNRNIIDRSLNDREKENLQRRSSSVLSNFAFHSIWLVTFPSLEYVNASRNSSSIKFPPFFFFYSSTLLPCVHDFGNEIFSCSRRS